MTRARAGRWMSALALILACGVLDGKSGLLVGAGVVVTLVGGARPKSLITLAGALFVLTPLSMLRQGLVSPEQLQLQLVSRYSLTNNLAFAGFAYLVVGVLLEVHRAPRDEHEVAADGADMHELDPRERADPLDHLDPPDRQDRTVPVDPELALASVTSGLFARPAPPAPFDATRAEHDHADDLDDDDPEEDRDRDDDLDVDRDDDLEGDPDVDLEGDPDVDLEGDPDDHLADDLALDDAPEPGDDPDLPDDRDGDDLTPAGDPDLDDPQVAPAPAAGVEPGDEGEAGDEDLTGTEPVRDHRGDPEPLDPMARGFRALEQALREAYPPDPPDPTHPSTTEHPEAT